MKRFLLTSILFVATSTFARAELHVIRGVHFDSDYEFAMSDEYEDLHGSWGNSRYDLVWDSYNGVLEGYTAGEEEYLEIDSVFRTIQLTAYCGWGDLQYSEKAPWRVWGTLCLENIDKVFESQAESEAWMKRELVSRMVTEFPEPTKVDVQAFLEGLLLF